MVSEIRIYVEGGGNSKDTRARMREGFSGFLRDLVDKARQKRIRWQIIACGARNDAFADFVTALETHPDAFNVLLVDAEGPVLTTPWQHLRERDHWNPPQNVNDDQCHLMVQTMEAWIIADPDALRQFYGQGFNATMLPHNPNVEQVDRHTLAATLRNATRTTGKGEYHKIRHGSRLLTLVNVATVRSAATYCDRLFTTLIGKMG